MLEPGLYDQLITDGLLAQLSEDAVTSEVEDADSIERYASHVHRVLARELPDVEMEQRHRIVKQVLRSLGMPGETPMFPLRLLTVVPRRNALGGPVVPAAPQIPLAQHDPRSMKALGLCAISISSMRHIPMNGVPTRRLSRSPSWCLRARRSALRPRGPT